MSILDRLLARITPEIRAKTERRMGIPLLIDGTMKAKGMSHKEFAFKIGRKKADIPFMLSGNYNYTVDELTQIEFALETKLFFSTALDWTPHLNQKPQYAENFEPLSVAAEPNSEFYS
jgi:hypothetical protein